MASTIAQDISAVRNAIYGRDVREAIASGLEHCYNLHNVAEEARYIENAIAEFEQRKDQVAATIASMASLGTDTTLSTKGMAADAEKVGILRQALKMLTAAKIDASVLTQGGYSTAGGMTGALNRIRLIAPFWAEKGTIVDVSAIPETLYTQVWYCSSPTAETGSVIGGTGDSTWDTINETKRFVVSRDCYVMMAFYFVADTTAAITVNDFGNEVITIKRPLTNSIIPDESYIEKIDEFNLLVAQMADINNSEAFLFFTDSHYFGTDSGETAFVNAVNKMKIAYQHTPVDFCIFGGDIVDGSVANPTMQLALRSMIAHNKMCEQAFGKDAFFPIIGNHDHNYYDSTQFISTDKLRDILFKQYGNTYYKKVFRSTTIYFLDTGLNHIDGDYAVPMDDYKWEQMYWLGQSLIDDDPEHAIIVMHIIRNNNEPKTFEFFEKVNALCAAYNGKTNLEVNGQTFDFSLKNGKIEMILGGHLHGDYKIVQNGIPCVMRDNTNNDLIDPTFDLILCDWGSGKIYFKRFGVGSDLILTI